jgi:hypothetical protein
VRAAARLAGPSQVRAVLLRLALLACAGLLWILPLLEIGW